MSVPSGTKFIGISSNVDLLERKSALLNSTSNIYTIEDIVEASKSNEESKPIEGVKPYELPYKVYTALLTQNGESYVGNLFEGKLTVGMTYMIIQGESEMTERPNGFDFTNVGAPNNDIGTQFVATGEDPISWGEGIALQFDTGAPLVIVLENTIGDIYFQYKEKGVYQVRSNYLFSPDKTTVSIDSFGQNENIGAFILNSTNIKEEEFLIRTFFFKGENTDGILQKNRIEIRVYN